MKLKKYKMKVEKVKNSWMVFDGQFYNYFDNKKDAICYMMFVDHFCKIFIEKQK